ncbi:MAG: DUF2267 domain-containing protein [Bradyrhizobium sp.]
MDELVGRLAAKAGIDDAVAEKAAGILLGFLCKESPTNRVQASIDSIPGAETAISASARRAGLDLSVGGIQDIAGELFRFGRDKIGAEHMSEIISGTPGLSQFV